MKKLYILTVIFITTSCNLDPDDKITIMPQVAEPYESTETQFTTSEAIIYFTGALECTGTGNYAFDDTKVLEDLEIPADLPEDFDLSMLLPPIGNQGRQGSCTSWATTYYLKSFQEHLESGLPYSQDRLMSPAYTYNQITQGICEGTSFEDTLNILIENGTTTLASFPYLDNSCNIQPNDVQNAEAEVNKIADYKYLSGIDMVLEMKALINEQTPILIAAFLTPEFGVVDNQGLTAYRPHTVNYSEAGGCHAMLVVGYSDINNAFKVVNSWGSDWGDNGFVWIDYAAFDNTTDNTADFRVINTAIVVYDLEE